ncbi:MAG: FAD-dependent oxidoreductase [Pseudomonadota bacterium]
MTNQGKPQLSDSFDVIILGSGVAGLTTALTLAKQGKNVLVIEKRKRLGGATARSEGMAWIPLSRQAKEAAVHDTQQDALQYLLSVSDKTNLKRAESYVENASNALDFVERNSPVKYELVLGSYDYYDTLEGALKGGRALRPLPLDALKSKFDLNRIEPPLPTTMIFGGMTVASKDLPDYMNMTRSPGAALRATSLICRYIWDRVRGYSRGQRIAGGNALIAGLIQGAESCGVTIASDVRPIELLKQASAVTGIKVSIQGTVRTIKCVDGVVLCCGGWSWSWDRRNEWFPHQDAEHHSLTPKSGAEGDAISLARKFGARVDQSPEHPAAWSPVSLVPQHDQSTAPFPHYIDRNKPGIFAVTEDGKRFANEAAPYQDFTAAMIEGLQKAPEKRFYLIADSQAIKRYGLGAAPPSPGNRRPFTRSGYLKKAKSLEELAHLCKIDEGALLQTVNTMNEAARLGEDTEFGRGSSEYDRSNGDALQSPKNPNLGPCKTGPYFAVQIYPGDIATFYGLSVNEHSQVLGEQERPIAGLYSAGSDAITIAGGTYPAAGMTIGPAMTFGYTAAKHILRRNADSHSQQAA